MKHLKTLGIIGAVIVLSVGILASMFSIILPITGHTSVSAGMPMLGHVTLMVKDVQGHILEYRQGDNTVVTMGKSCVAARIFGPQSSACPFPGTTSYDVLAVGTGGSPPTQPATSATRLVTEITSPSQMARGTATSDTVVDASGAVGAIVTMSKQFTNNAAGIINVNEAGVFNSTTVSSAGMFSAQTFTAIPLNQNDTLTVTWTINVG
jgi:hypothetical protein